MIIDRFDREELGSNWESPAWPPARDDGPLIMIPDKDGVQMNLIDLNDENCSGTYIGQEFTYNRCFAEVEQLHEFEYDDYPTYFEDFGHCGVRLNIPLASSGSRRGVITRFWPYMSQSYTSFYRQIYWDMNSYDDAGVITWETYGFVDPLELFDTADLVPAGVKIRLERVGDVYYSLLYTPHKNFWRVLGSATITGKNDGYPGLFLYALSDVEDAQATNFKAGSDGDTFFMSNTLTAADNTVRGLARDLARDLYASSNALVRNIGGEASVPIVFESGSFIEDFAFNNVEPLDITAPAGVQAGDLLLFFVVIANDYSTEANYEPTEATYPFTTVSSDSQTSGSDFCCYVMYRIATGSEPAAYSFTKTDINSLVTWATMYRVSGVNQSTPIEVDIDIANTALIGDLSVDPGAITTTNDSCKIVSAVMNRGNSVEDTASTGMEWMTNIGDGKLLIQTGDAGPAGVVDLDTVSWTGGITNITSVHTFALIPA